MSESIPTSFSPAKPAVTVAPYLGGKRNLSRRIIDRLAGMPHQTYVEPFVGMGGVFFRRPFKAHCEVINDISLDVARSPISSARPDSSTCSAWPSAAA